MLPPYSYPIGNSDSGLKSKEGLDHLSFSFNDVSTAERSGQRRLSGPRPLPIDLAVRRPSATYLFAARAASVGLSPITSLLSRALERAQPVPCVEVVST